MDPRGAASNPEVNVSQRLEEEIARADGEEKYEDIVETLEELAEKNDDDTTTNKPPTQPNIVEDKGESEKRHFQYFYTPTSERQEVAPAKPPPTEDEGMLEIAIKKSPLLW